MDAMVAFKTKKAAEAACAVYAKFKVPTVIEKDPINKVYDIFYVGPKDLSIFKNRPGKKMMHGKAYMAAYRAVKGKAFNGKDWDDYFSISA
jgi:hypothetical protein